MNTIKTNDVAKVQELSDAELEGVAGGFCGFFLPQTIDLTKHLIDGDPVHKVDLTKTLVD